MPGVVHYLAFRAMRRMLCHMTAVHGEPPAANTGHGWTPDDSEFGARLAMVRQRMKWNIKEAAVACTLPPASWASWEAGAMPRNLQQTCRKIADATGADYIWLLAGSLSAGIRRTSSRPQDRPGSHVVRTTPDRPIVGKRRDSVRPVSAIPAAQRRPVSLRPAARPMNV